MNADAEYITCPDCRAKVRRGLFHECASGPGWCGEKDENAYPTKERDWYLPCPRCGHWRDPTREHYCPPPWSTDPDETAPGPGALLAQRQALALAKLRERGAEIMETKAHDYAAAHDRFSNFRIAGFLIGHAIRAGMDGQYVDVIALMGTKIARLIELLGGKEPANESVTDTCIDLSNYALILGAMVQTDD